MRVHNRSDTGGEANVIAASEQLCRCLSLAGACEMRCEQCEQETRATDVSNQALDELSTLGAPPAHDHRHAFTHKTTTTDKTKAFKEANKSLHTSQQRRRPTGSQPPSSSALPTEQQWKRSLICLLCRSGLNIITTVYSCTVQTRACSRWMRCEVRLG